jgi:hypothetical protein
MDQINEFLEIEVSDRIKKLLLDTLDKLKNDAKAENQEMTFNVYSVIFSIRNDEVQICNDILPDLQPVSMSFEEFRNILEQYKSN